MASSRYAERPCGSRTKGLDVALTIGAVKEGGRISSTRRSSIPPTPRSVRLSSPSPFRELPSMDACERISCLTVPGAHVGFGAQNGQTISLLAVTGSAQPVIGGARPNAPPLLPAGWRTINDPTFNPRSQSLAESGMDVPGGHQKLHAVWAAQAAVRSHVTDLARPVHARFEFLANGARSKPSSPWATITGSRTISAHLRGPLLGKRVSEHSSF